MNILQGKRKFKKRINFRTLVLLMFSLIMTTFAWFTYTKVLEPALSIHIATWDIEYWIGEDKQEDTENGLKIDIDTLYPTMEEQTVTIDIYNKGEALVDIEHQVKSITILGTEYEIVEQGSSPETENYITIVPAEITTNEETGEQIYKGAILNNATKLNNTTEVPFTIEIEHSTQVKPATQGTGGNKTPGQGYLKVTANWAGDNDDLDSEWGYMAGEYMSAVQNIQTFSRRLRAQPEMPAAISMLINMGSYQGDDIINDEDSSEGNTDIVDPSKPEEEPTVTHTHELIKVPAKDATYITEGNIEYYICTECNSWFEDNEGKSEITNKASVVISMLEYEILEGGVQTYTGNQDITVRASGDFEYFTGLKVDGNLISEDNYTAKSGSTIVTLKDSYLSTLDNGTYKLTFVYINGEVSTEFKVAKVETPNTPNIPDVPETPDTPEEPNTPDVPETPDTPEEPNTPDIPETPDTQETPEVQEKPETSTEDTESDITNTPTSSSPKTGDNIYMYIALMIFAAIGIFVTVKFFRKTNKENKK